MATKVFMEALSPTMEEGRRVKWLKNEGDAVKNGDTLAEVETDKAIMELAARGDGVLRKRLINEGEAKPVGTLIGVIATADENIDALVSGAGGGPGGAATTTATATNQSETPAASPTPQTATQSQGEASTPPQEKAGARATAPAQGGQQQPPAASSAQAQAQPTSTIGGQVRSSPLARRMATEKGVDLSSIQGSGLGPLPPSPLAPRPGRPNITPPPRGPPRRAGR